MNCEEIKHLLSLYLDKQLGDADRIKVEEHLKGCTDCTAYYNRLLKLQEMADEFKPGGDHDYWLKQKDIIIEKIEQAEASGVTPIRAKKSRIMTYRILAVAATITLVAILSIFELKYNEPEKLPFRKKSVPAMQTSSASVQPELKDNNLAQKTEVGQKEEVTIQDKSQVKGRAVEKEESRSMAIPEPAVPEGKLTIEKDVEPVRPEAASLPVPESKPAVKEYPEISVKKNAVEFSTRGSAEKAEPAIEKDKAREEKHFDQLMAVPKPGGSVAVSDEEAPVNDYALSLTAKKGKMQMPEKGSVEEGSIKNEEYSKWRGKVDSLEARYGYILSVHSDEIVSKSRLAQVADSRQSESLSTPPYSEMANAFYTLATVTPFDDEREAMIQKLKRLAEIADSSSVKEIDEFINKLESKSK